MHSPKMDQFLDEILKYVKFRGDRPEIRSELSNHIIDKVEYYTEQGMDQATAEQLSIKDMGDAEEIGRALNKQHNPILGWFWTISNVILVLIIAYSLYFFGATILYSFTNMNLLKEIPKSNIVYRIDLKKTVKLDDTVIKITNVIYEKNGNMNILYESYDTRLWGAGWSFDTIRTVSDNLGNQYFSGGGTSSGGFISRGIRTFNDFSSEADTLILEYDSYHRYFKIEIPLKAGVE